MGSDERCTYQLPEQLRDERLGQQDWSCKERGVSAVSTKHGRYCIFHIPDPNSREKELGSFTDAIQSKCDSNYRGYVFPTGFIASHLQFERADFSDARFLGYADFSERTFEGSTHFRGVTFDRGANFEGATFYGNVDFASASFNGEVNLRNASFLRLRQREETSHEVDNALMFGAENFYAARFECGADFSNSKFENTSGFSGATFSGDAVFSQTVFHEGAKADFTGTTFGKYCYFIGTHSRSEITFFECVFHEEVVFRGAAFEGLTGIHASTFGRAARFGNHSLQDCNGRRLKVRFVEMDMERVAFRYASLREVTFYDCSNLDKTEIFACLWNKAFNRQRVLYGELALRGCKPKWGARVPGVVNYTRPPDEEWQRVENTYRDLRRNFEGRRDYAGASEFYVGEMELRRIKKPVFQREVLSLEALYFHLSEYGENWWKPLIWLSVLLLLGTTVYTGWGLRLDNPEFFGESVIRIYWQPGAASPANDLKMLGLAFLHSLSALSFLRASVAEPLHWTGQFTAILQLLLSPILITLSLLAIRRKLKR